MPTSVDLDILTSNPSQLPIMNLMSDLKPTVSKEESLDLLDIRMGKVLSAELAVDAPKPSYIIRADFGKYGIRTSVGRLTTHAPDELVGRYIFGVLNFEPRFVGGVASEFLTLGVQVTKADSGEATIVTPLSENVKVGSKLF